MHRAVLITLNEAIKISREIILRATEGNTGQQISSIVNLDKYTHQLSLKYSHPNKYLSLYHFILV